MISTNSFLGLFVPNSYICNVRAHIHAHLWYKNYFYFIPILYCFERHSTRYIGEHSSLVKIQRKLSKNDQLPALASLGPHAFGFHAVG